MKITHALVILVAVTIMVWTAGCSSTTPKPVTTIKGDLQFTEEITATVTADQAFVMDGQKLKVADIPQQLVKMKASKYITIIIYPESKMTMETLVELVNTMVKNNYSVSIAVKSKYADVPIPCS